jgi:aminoglycoside phosphotransferase (APT) family kinase protein
MDEQVLHGGVANAGAVTRVGQHVLRPSNEHTASIHRFLTWLHVAGFDGASVPVSVDADGRERLGFIDGDVPVPPYPAWAQSDAALASVTALLRRFHDAAASFDPTGSTWSSEMADAAGGSVVCHNDVCLENVVFRDGVAIGLLDFDFAAPGRPIYDLAQFARMCVPVDDPVSSARVGWATADRAARLRVVADAYGLSPGGRASLLEVLAESIARGGEFVRRRVDAGDQNFIAMWNAMGGMERFDRRRRWFDERRQQFDAAMR